MPVTKPDIARASFSDFCIAMRFGTSSPKTSIINDSSSVSTISTATSTAPLDALAGSLKRLLTGVTKLFAALALAISPAKVTPTWMVARNFAGLSISFISRFAFLPPSSAILRIFPSLTEMTAISLAAKKALTAISTISKSILSNMPVNSPSPETCEAVSTAEAPAKTGIILPPSIWVPVVFSFQINTIGALSAPSAGRRREAGDQSSTNYHNTIYKRFCQVQNKSRAVFNENNAACRLTGRQSE